MVTKNNAIKNIQEAVKKRNKLEVMLTYKKEVGCYSSIDDFDVREMQAQIKAIDKFIELNQEAKDWKIVGKEEEKSVPNKDGCGRHFPQDYCDCGEPEEEEPKEHMCELWNENPLGGGYFKRITIGKHIYTIDYILKALKAYEE